MTTKDFSELRHSRPTQAVPHPEWWKATDIQATEWEVSDLLWGLTRALQPRYVLETGSYDGQTTYEIARALEKNGHGLLVSLEIDKKMWRVARNKIVQMELKRAEVDVINTSSLEFQPARMIDLAFLDSGPGEEREMEFRRYFSAFHRGTVVVIHDARGPEYVIGQGISKLTEEGLFRPIFLPTPRGLCIGQPVTEKWHWSVPD